MPCNPLIVAVVHTFLLSLSGAYRSVNCLVLISLLFVLNNWLLTFFSRITTKGDPARIRAAAVFLPHLLRYPRYAVGAEVVTLGLLVVDAGAEELNRRIPFAATTA